MPSSLPDSPSVDKLREQARQLQRRVRAADPDALGFLTQWHPRPDRAAPDSLALHDAQLAVARRYGFAGWPALVGYVETAGALSRDPATVAEDALDPADLFCALGCLRYDERDEPPRRDRAAALLAGDPSLVHRSIWAAATAADPDAVRRHLDRDPSLGRRAGGPRRWEPLLYLCYSRVPTGRDVGEALYNRMFTPGVEHLELLFRHGLGGPDRGPWRRRLGDAMESPAELLDRQLHWAAEHGFTDRLELLARHGVDVSGVEVCDRSALPDDVNAKVGGRTALHDAAWGGDLERIGALLAAGADPGIADDAHGGRPLEWAEHAYQEEAAALLRRHTPDAGAPPA